MAPPLPRTDGVIVVAVTPTSAAAATDSSAAAAAVDDDVMKAMMMDVVLLPPPPFILSFHQQDVVNVLEITDITPQLKDEVRSRLFAHMEATRPWLPSYCCWCVLRNKMISVNLNNSYKSSLCIMPVPAHQLKDENGNQISIGMVALPLFQFVHRE